jgi:hypothetical protein
MKTHYRIAYTHKHMCAHTRTYFNCRAGLISVGSYLTNLSSQEQMKAQSEMGVQFSLWPESLPHPTLLTPDLQLFLLNAFPTLFDPSCH